MGEQQMGFCEMRKMGRVQMITKKLSEKSKVWLGEIQSFILKTQEIRRKVIEVTLK